MSFQSEEVRGEEFGDGRSEMGNGGAAVWADGERTVAAHEDSGEFITAWAERWGFANPNEAMEAISEVQECMAGANANSGAEKAREFMQRMAAVAAWFLSY